jgi:hypothetical protein
MEFSPESRYDWTRNQRWKWLGIKPSEFHLDVGIISKLWDMSNREYFLDMLEKKELKGKAEKDAKALKDNPQLEWGFK